MWMTLIALFACGTPAPAGGEHAHAHAHEGGEHAEGEHAHAHEHGEKGDGEHAHDHGEHGKHAKHGEQAEEGHGHHGDVHHRFDDPEKWAETFDDPERDAWQQPAKVVAALELSPGMAVADIGAGTGYFNPHLAAAVGAEGKVVAIDIEPKMVEYMTERAKRDSTPQVEARVTKPDAHGLAEGEVDRVLTVDTYHHIGDRVAYFASLKEALKPGGKLVIVDITKEAPFGPPVEARFTPAEITAELAEAGWEAAGQVDLPHQFVLSFTPKG